MSKKYTEPKMLDVNRLSEARQGSYYTVRGAGGPLKDWVNGLSEVFVAKGVGKPQRWFQTLGATVNEYTRAEGDDRFQPDMVILMCSLEGLDLSRLAIVRLEHGDVWFDDMVDNMKSSEVL